MQLQDLEVQSYLLRIDSKWGKILLERLVYDREGNEHWAINRLGSCLSKSEKDFIVPPIKDERDAFFFEDCRWPTAEEALDFWCGL